MSFPNQTLLSNYFVALSKRFDLYAYRVLVHGQVAYVPCVLFEQDSDYLEFEKVRSVLEKSHDIHPEREMKTNETKLLVRWPKCHLEVEQMDTIIKGIFDQFGWTLRGK